MYILVFDDWFQMFEQIPTKKTTNNVHCINIKLRGGCFHNGPVMCPKSLIMAQEVCIGPRQRRGLVHASRAIDTDRGHMTGTL